jgi:hypothetical protein
VFPQLPIEWGGVFLVFKGVSSIGGVGGGAIAKPLIMAFFGINFNGVIGLWLISLRLYSL